MQVERHRKRIHSSVRREALNREGDSGKGKFSRRVDERCGKETRCFLTHLSMLSACGRYQAGPQFLYARSCRTSRSRGNLLRYLSLLLEEDADGADRSEEHTSELQSHVNL